MCWRWAGRVLTICPRCADHVLTGKIPFTSDGWCYDNWTGWNTYAETPAIACCLCLSGSAVHATALLPGLCCTCSTVEATQVRNRGTYRLNISQTFGFKTLVSFQMQRSRILCSTCCRVWVPHYKQHCKQQQGPIPYWLI